MQMLKERTLILASSSPRRQELIRTLRLPVRILASNVDETVAEEMAPADIVEALSLRKALAVTELLLLESQEEDGIVIGSDTIVVSEGRILGKPADDEDAMRMLTLLQGQTHQVYSGVACIDLASRKQKVSHRMTEVTMRSLSSQQISHYIASGEPRDKAGAYGIQGLGATLIDSINGCYFNVVGLPLSLLTRMIGELGVEVL